MSESGADAQRGRTAGVEDASSGQEPRGKPPEFIKVAIIGAGMAGLTAALRLAERGYAVTVFEDKPYIGGQFGAHTHDRSSVAIDDRLYHDHCYHMLLNWYHNFWRVVDDIGLSRDEDFEPRAAIRHLARGDSRMPALVNPGSVRSVWDNLLSGLAPPPDMFLYAYSMIDLATQPFPADGLLGKYTVNGFLQTRPYASERSAELHQHTMAKVFGAPSYLTSAASYKNLVKYGLRRPEPMMWILKGNSQRKLFGPFLDALDALNVPVKRLRRVTSIGFGLRPKHERLARKPSSYLARNLMFAEVPDEISLRECRTDLLDCSKDLPDAKPNEWEPKNTQPYADFEYLIVAVPPRALKNIKIQKADANTPDLKSNLPPIPRIKLGLPPIPKLKVQPMASLDLYFKRRLPGIPREHVVLLGAEYGLTFLDNSQVGSGYEHAAPRLPGCTVLNVVASDFGALANLTADEAICAILHELARYIPFDDKKDIARLHFQTNIGDELFVNEVGSEQWRPGARTLVPNMFLAGDYCRTFVDIVSIEAAVVSGLEAARAVQAAVMDRYEFEEDDPRISPIEIVEPEAHDEAAMTAVKLALAPYAYAAKCLSSLQEEAASSPAGLGRLDPFAPSGDLVAAPGDLFTAGTRLMVAPWVMAADFVTSGCSVWADLYRQWGLGR